MENPAVTNAKWWADFWETIENWAFFGVVLTLAVEFVAVQLLKSPRRVIDDARQLEIAELNNSAERLRGDNLALQTVLLPRHAGIIGIDQAAPADKWFAGTENFAGTEISLQVVADAEAQNLANEIAFALRARGWKTRFIDEKTTNFLSARIMDGVQVSYPIGKTWTPDTQNEPWFIWAKAANSLATALTRANLAPGGREISAYGLRNEQQSVGTYGLSPYFDPPLEGVYLQVGARPVAETIEWIKRGRPDSLGNIPGLLSKPPP
ncbi:MAG: hypothetical protein E7774_11065 [Bradyrhizobium sp.]|nr:MAG: hypothetical protein E7774_11065 [Bradyrhizobium sp.]